MAPATRKLCVLVPARNCAEFLPELRSRIELPGIADEIIIVDDASTDDTFGVAGALPRVHAVRNPVCLRYGGTSRRLYEIALERGADVTVNVHGDLGHRPEDIPLLLAKLDEGHDLAIGSRTMFVLESVRRHGWTSMLSAEAASGMPPSRVVGHVALTWFQNVCFGTKLHSFHDGMRACTRSTVEWVVRQALPEWYNYDEGLLLCAYYAGLRIAEVPVAPNYDPRAHSAAPRISYGLKAAGRAAWGLVCRNLGGGMWAEPQAGRPAGARSPD